MRLFRYEKKHTCTKALNTSWGKRRPWTFNIDYRWRINFVLLLKTFTIHCRGWRTQIVAEGVYPEKHFLCGRNPPPPFPPLLYKPPFLFWRMWVRKREERRGGRNWRALTFFGTNWGGMEAVLCEANDLRTKLDSNHQMTSHIHIWKKTELKGS
jgi:hypothetical protein